MRSCFTIPLLLLGLLFSVRHLPAQINSFPEMSTGSRLGAGVRDIDADRAAALKLGSVTGVEVITVESGSPAELAGIKPGDVLLSYNGESIIGGMQLGRMISETPVGRKVKIEYFRNGKVVTVTAVTAARPVRVLTFGNEPGFNFDDLLASPFPNPRFTWTSPQLGIEYEGLDANNSQLAEYFGVKHGLLVRAVARDSAGAKAGLRAGDVILQIGGHAISDPKEINYYIRQEQHLGKSFPVEIMREHKESTVKVSFGLEAQE